MKVTVWNEFVHEQENEDIRKVYPEGIHGEIAGFLKENGFDVKTATLEMPEHGLTDEVLENTDVLLWWGHKAHKDVSDEIGEKVYERVLKGMGLIVLHSGHFSKIFKKLMGTSCTLKWRDDDRERLWCVNPSHPICEGVPEYFDLENEEMYGEYFDIPSDGEIIYLGWFKGGEAVRSGITFKRGRGKIFYFQPGHESYPTYHNPQIIRIIKNAVHWAYSGFREEINCPHVKRIGE